MGNESLFAAPFLRSKRSIQPLLLAITLIFLWFYYAQLEILAQPDFYKYYFEAQKLFDMNFSNMRIPPLFTFLLGLISKLFRLFSDSDSIPLWTGRSLNLIATLWGLFFLNRLAQRFYSSGRSFFIWTLCLSPLYLNFFSTPVTEMIFLCFFLGFFDAVSRNRTAAVLLFSILAVATRFEGVLLLAIAAAHIFQHPRAKKFRIPAFVFLGLSLSSVYFLLGSIFAKRIQFHMDNFLGPKGLSYFFNHPDHLLNIVYSNIFFFLPAPAPIYFQVIALTILGLLLLIGFLLIRKTAPFLAWSSIFFLISFILAKSYLSYSDKFTPNTRRVLYPIVLLLLLAFWGLQHLYKKAQENKRLSAFLLAAVLCIIFFIFHVPKMHTHFQVWGFIFLIPFAGFLLSHPHIWQKWKLVLLAGIPFFLFLFLLANISLKTSQRYVISSPNKGAYAIAQYLNHHPEKKEILLLTAPATLRYYYKGSARKIHLGSTFGTRQFNQKEQFIAELKNLVTKHNNSAIAFDYYMDYPGSVIAQMKHFLMRIRKNPAIFLSKRLFYKGKTVAFILIPSFPGYNKYSL